MIDLHTHTFFSDGALVPAEHVRRVEVLGYTAIAITDHADSSNIHFLIPNLLRGPRPEPGQPYPADRGRGTHPRASKPDRSAGA